MDDRAHGGFALTFLLTSVSVLVYFFLFPFPLDTELAALPRWAVRIVPGGGRSQSGVPAGVPDGTRIAFSSGSSYGYFSSDGTVFFADSAQGGVTVSDNAYALLDEPALYSATSRSRIAALSGIPFFAHDELFSAAADGTALLAYGPDGSRRWSYQFPAPLSAFGSTGALSVGGTVDGLIEGVSADGRQLFSFAPGGSRLQVILGLAVSPLTGRVAAISGLDRQRLVVLGPGGASYRVDSHRYLDSDYRSPVDIAFLDEDRYVVYPRPDGIGVWAVDGSVDTLLPVQADRFSLAMDDDTGVAFLMAVQGQHTELVVFRPPNALIGRIPMPGAVDFLHIDASTLYFLSGDTMARVDFRQE